MKSLTTTYASSFTNSLYGSSVINCEKSRIKPAGNASCAIPRVYCFKKTDSISFLASRKFNGKPKLQNKNIKALAMPSMKNEAIKEKSIDTSGNVFNAKNAIFLENLKKRLQSVDKFIDSHRSPVGNNDDNNSFENLTENQRFISNTISKQVSHNESELDAFMCGKKKDQYNNIGNSKNDSNEECRINEIKSLKRGNYVNFR